MFVQPAAGGGGGGGGGEDGGAPSYTYHALFHDHVSFGGHAFSSDGRDWSYSATAPYSNLLNFTDGAGIALQRRERPHLAFDDAGYISHLTTSAQPPPTAAKGPPAGCVNDHSFTSIQPVARQQQRLAQPPTQKVRSIATSRDTALYE